MKGLIVSWESFFSQWVFDGGISTISVERIVEEMPTLTGYPTISFLNNILNLFFENFLYVYNVS